MITHDKMGRSYAKLSELKEGDTIELDGSFDCASGKKILKAHSDCDPPLYFECEHGSHFIDGQADDGEYLIGIYKSAAATRKR